MTHRKFLLTAFALATTLIFPSSKVAAVGPKPAETTGQVQPKKRSCRIAWKSLKTGYTGHGDWFPVKKKELLNEYIDDVSVKYPEIHHYLEFN